MPHYLAQVPTTAQSCFTAPPLMFAAYKITPAALTRRSGLLRKQKYGTNPSGSISSMPQTTPSNRGVRTTHSMRARATQAGSPASSQASETFFVTEAGLT